MSKSWLTGNQNSSSEILADWKPKKSFEILADWKPKRSSEILGTAPRTMKTFVSSFFNK